ncbi:MAG: glycosyltransferase [Magnetococcus sp. WYHC-3]
MKIALVHDYLCGRGGSERVFQYICEAFPEADAYVLAYNPKQSSSYFRNRGLRTTWMNRFVQTMESFRLAFPLATYAMQGIDLSGYDLVVTSSATVAKYVRVPNGHHICYCYIPTRAIWQTDEYFGRSITAAVFRVLLPYLKQRDFSAAQAVDHFVAISQDSREHIRQSYRRDAQIIYSPIDLDRFHVSYNRGDHYLIVSRLEYWKRLDYAIEAFNRMALPLRIVGDGKERKALEAMAGKTISFLGSVDDETLQREYGNAKGVVFTPFLEYGLIPLEACACGTPVICLGKGGIIETMVPWTESGQKNPAPTAVFFQEQNAEALCDAIRKFERLTFDPDALAAHAKRFGVPEFKRQLTELVESYSARMKRGV